MWAYIVLGFSLAIWVMLISKYNKIVYLKNTREQSFADIDVQLKQRFNLIPNLMEAVKGYMKHEKTLLEDLTKARTSFMQAGDASSKIWADNMLTGALKSVFAVAENYPDLKANQNFMQFQQELSDIENKISAARRFFNNATKEYNAFIEMFPNNIIAGMFKFERQKMYEVENKEEKKNIKVAF